MIFIWLNLEFGNNNCPTIGVQGEREPGGLSEQEPQQLPERVRDGHGRSFGSWPWQKRNNPVTCTHIPRVLLCQNMGCARLLQPDAV